MSVQTPSPHTWTNRPGEAGTCLQVAQNGLAWTGPFIPPCPPPLFSFCVGSALIPISSLGLGTLWWLRFTLITSLKILPPYILVLRSWGLGHPHLNMGHSLAQKSPWTPAVFSVRGFLDPTQTYPSVFFPLKICCNLSLASLDHFVPWASYLLINLLSF